MAEVKTLKSENSILKTKLKERQQPEFHVQTPQAFRSHIENYKNQIRQLQNELAELKNLRNIGQGSNVHMKYLEEENFSLKEDVRHYKAELDNKRKTFERRVFEIEGRYGQTVEELKSAKGRIRELAYRLGIKDPNVEFDQRSFKDTQSYNDDYLVGKLKADKERLKNKLKDFIDQANNDRKEIEDKTKEILNDNETLKKSLKEKEELFEKEKEEFNRKKEELNKELDDIKEKNLLEKKAKRENRHLSDKIESLQRELNKARNDTIKLKEQSLKAENEKFDLQHDLNMMRLTKNNNESGLANITVLDREVEHLKSMLDLKEKELKEANDIIKSKNKDIEELTEKSIHMKPIKEKGKSGGSPLPEVDNELTTIIRVAVEEKSEEQRMKSQEIYFLKKVEISNNRELERIEEEIRHKEDLIRLKSMKSYMLSQQDQFGHHNNDEPKTSIGKLMNKEAGFRDDIAKILKEKKQNIEDMNRFQFKALESVNKQITAQNRFIQTLANKTSGDYIQNQLDSNDHSGYTGRSYYDRFANDSTSRRREEELAGVLGEIKILKTRCQLVQDRIDNRRDLLKQKKDRLDKLLKEQTDNKGNVFDNTPDDQDDFEINFLKTEIEHLNRLNKTNDDNFNKSKDLYDNKKKEIGAFLDQLDEQLDKAIKNNKKPISFGHGKGYDPVKERTSHPYSRNNNNDDYSSPSKYNNPVNDSMSGYRDDLGNTINTNKSPRFPYHVDPKLIDTEFPSETKERTSKNRPYAVQDDDFVKKYTRTNDLADDISKLKQTAQDILDKSRSHSRNREKEYSRQNSYKSIPDNKSRDGDKNVIRIERQSKYGDRPYVHEIHYNKSDRSIKKGNRSYSPGHNVSPGGSMRGEERPSTSGYRGGERDKSGGNRYDPYNGNQYLKVSNDPRGQNERDKNSPFNRQSRRGDPSQDRHSRTGNPSSNRHNRTGDPSQDKHNRTGHSPHDRHSRTGNPSSNRHNRTGNPSQDKHFATDPYNKHGRESHSPYNDKTGRTDKHPRDSYNRSGNSPYNKNNPNDSKYNPGFNNSNLNKSNSNSSIPPLDIDKLAKIISQKPFYLSSPMEVPKKMLSYVNKVEELKFALLKNGKDMDGFLDTIDYLTTENNILKQRLEGSQKKTDIEVGNELAALKENLTSIADRAESLIVENDGLIKKNNMLKKENNQLKVERDNGLYKNNMELEDLANQKRQIGQQLRAMEDEQRANNLRSKRLERELEDLNDNSVGKEEHERLAREYKDAVGDLYKAQQEAKEAKLEAADMKYALSQLKNQQGVSDLDHERLRNQLTHREKEIGYLKGKLEEYDTKLKSVANTSIQELNELREQSEGVKLKSKDLENILAIRNKEINHLKEKLGDEDLVSKKETEGLRNYVGKLQTQQSDFERIIQELKSKLEIKNNELLKQVRLIREHEDTIKELRRQLKTLRPVKKEKEDLDLELEKNRAYVQTVNSELEDLKPIVKRFRDLQRTTEGIKSELNKYRDFYEQYKDDVDRLEEERSRLIDRLDRLQVKNEELEKTNGRKVQLIGKLQVKCFALFMELDRLNGAGRENTDRNRSRSRERSEGLRHRQRA